ncbi:MAG: glutathione S-transferase family protein [Deltaproteobacteria bacterium]|nr:MAG: glutathione S-transferase family protein [Deltaproteobacteria bacterium]
MSIILHHHPLTRARHVVWMLEEVGVDYTLNFLDLMQGEGRSAEHLQRNRMGKLPTLEDQGVFVSEASAIGMYLADRYALGHLAPAFDDPLRGPYLRWCVFGPSVVEPGCMAKAADWPCSPQRVGWGAYDDMVATLEGAIGEGPWLFGERFTMADVLLGGTIRWMLKFKMLQGSNDILRSYGARLGERDASKRAEAINQKVCVDRGLPTG